MGVSNDWCMTICGGVEAGDTVPMGDVVPAGDAACTGVGVMNKLVPPRVTLLVIGVGGSGGR